MLKPLTALAFVSLLTACSTVTIHPQQTQKLSSPPTYKTSKSFFLWGLVGEHRVDTIAICNGAEPKQMQSQQTFTDGLLGIVTLGIYTPHTVKVWC